MNEKNQSKKGVLSVSSKYTISNQLVNSECGGQPILFTWDSTEPLEFDNLPVLFEILTSFHIPFTLDMFTMGLQIQ